MTASLLKFAPPGNPGAPNRGPEMGRGIGGFLGAGGILIELKHGIPALMAPFWECGTLSEAFQVIGKMEDVAFLGWFGWLALLVTSLVAVGSAAMFLIKRALENLRPP